MNKCIWNFEKLFNPLNNFIAICAVVFENSTTLKFVENNATKNYINSFYKTLSKSNKKLAKKTEFVLFFKKRIKVIKKAILDKKMRRWLIQHLLDKKWQNEKLVQLGVKKPKQDL